MKMLKINEAAKFLNVHPNAVRKLIKDGNLPALQLGPKTWRVRIEDLEAMRGVK